MNRLKCNIQINITCYTFFNSNLKTLSTINIQTKPKKNKLKLITYYWHAYYNSFRLHTQQNEQKKKITCHKWIVLSLNNNSTTIVRYVICFAFNIGITFGEYAFETFVIGLHVDVMAWVKDSILFQKINTNTNNEYLLHSRI